MNAVAGTVSWTGRSSADGHAPSRGEADRTGTGRNGIRRDESPPRLFRTGQGVQVARQQFNCRRACSHRTDALAPVCDGDAPRHGPHPPLETEPCSIDTSGNRLGDNSFPLVHAVPGRYPGTPPSRRDGVIGLCGRNRKSPSVSLVWREVRAKNGAGASPAFQGAPADDRMVLASTAGQQLVSPQVASLTLACRVSKPTAPT